METAVDSELDTGSEVLPGEDVEVTAVEAAIVGVDEDSGVAGTDVGT